MNPAISPIGARIVAQALKFVGQGEQPPGSNKGPLVNRVLAFVGLPPGNQWCAAFASWCVAQAGVPSGPKTGSTGGLYDWAAAHDAVIYDPYDDEAPGNPAHVQPGDLGLVMDDATATGYRHTVIIRGLLPGGMVQTVEGNFGDKVSLNKRAIKTMTVIRPYP